MKDQAQMPLPKPFMHEILGIDSYSAKDLMSLNIWPDLF